MDDKQTAMVCEPFYRVDAARSRSSGGVGLGLSLCREIARLHGAELVIKSVPGEGTVVRVVFTTSLQLSEDSLIPGKV
jgi:signal transduction histidine kinase